MRAYSVSSSSSDDDVSSGSPSEDGIESAGGALSWPEAERVTSSLFTKEDVDELCPSAVSKDAVAAARPAGDLRMCSPPPAGDVCVYSHALEAGFCCEPLQVHAFFCEVLGHFSLAPSQLAPNGWRSMAHFYKLCGSARVRPSLTLFRQFLRLYKMPKSNGWYNFRSMYISLPATARLTSSWKEGFFFVSSPASWTWTCPTQWGEPSEESKIQPVLNDDELAPARKLLRARDSASVDTVKTMMVKIEPHSDRDTPGTSPFSGRKRKLEEANTPLLQAVKNATELQKKLVAREREAAAESRARRAELKKLTATLSKAAKADSLRKEVRKLEAELCKANGTSMQEGQMCGLLRGEAKKLRAEKTVAKEAAEAEGEKAAARQEELEKVKVAEANKTAGLQEKLRAAEAKKAAALQKLEKLKATEAEKAAALQAELEKMKAAEANKAEPVKTREEFDIYLS